MSLPFILEWHPDRPQNFDSMVETIASSEGISNARLAAIAYIESRGNSKAVNPADPSYGIMQMTIPTATFYNEGKAATPDLLLNNPARALRLGARFIADLQRKYAARFRFSEWAQAYNVGETKFNKGIRNPKYGAVVKRTDGAEVFLNAEELASIL